MSVFDENEEVRLLEAIYATRDMAFQRLEIIHALHLKRGERVLDIGAGHGFLASEMGIVVGSTGRVCGIDNSKAMIANASRRCAHQQWIEFRKREASSLAFSGSSFDVVTAIQVFEYIKDVAAALREVYRVLCPGGRVLVLDTNWDSLIWHSNDAVRMKRILTAWNTHCDDPFLPRTLASKLKEAGFHLTQQGIIPIENTECEMEDFNLELNDSVTNFSSGLINSIKRHIITEMGISQEEVSAWADDLRRLSKNGEYFFRLERSLFLAVKP